MCWFGSNRGVRCVCAPNSAGGTLPGGLRRDEREQKGERGAGPGLDARGPGAGKGGCDPSAPSSTSVGMAAAVVQDASAGAQIASAGVQGASAGTVMGRDAFGGVRGGRRITSEVSPAVREVGGRLEFELDAVFAAGLHQSPQQGSYPGEVASWRKSVRSGRH